MPSAHRGSQDWTAIVIVALVIAVLIAAGVYLTTHPGVLGRSMMAVANLIEALLSPTGSS